MSTKEDVGKCSCCQKQLTIGERFTIFDTRIQKRVNVECVKVEPNEFSFKVLDEDHSEYGEVITMERPITYIN